VLCEGPTEQGFCRQVLAPRLFSECERLVHTIEAAHSRHHGIVSRGGIGKSTRPSTRPSKCLDEITILFGMEPPFLRVLQPRGIAPLLFLSGQFPRKNFERDLKTGRVLV
jgi:hypothetical protein